MLLNNHQLENVGSHQKKIPHVQGQRRSLSKTVRGAKSHLESNPIPARDAWRAQTSPPKVLIGCAPGPRDPTETEPELGLSVSCRGTGQQWPATGAGALGTADLSMALALLEEVAIYTPQNHQNLHRTGETDSWRAQTKPCAHQDPGGRSSDP